MSELGGQVPQCTRALLRVEFTGGKVREFEAEHPSDVECVIETPLPREPWQADLTAPLAVTSAQVIDVRFGFHASRNLRGRHVMVMRTEAARSPQQILDEVRAQAVAWALNHPAADSPLASMLRQVGDQLTALIDGSRSPSG